MTTLTVSPTILKTVPLFSLLTDHQLASLYPAIQHRSYPRHSFMLRAGEKPDALYIILAGRAKVVMDDGEMLTLRAGDAFHLAPGHDSWVVGDETYVSLHLMGTDAYASR